MQSKRMSVIEAFANVMVGYGVALGSQLIIFPAFNIHVSIQQNIQITNYFTAISIVRSYTLRRVFNRALKRRSELN